MKLVTLRKPSPEAKKAATEYVRDIFFAKLMLFIALIPLAIAGLFELPHLFEPADSRIHVAPILVGIATGSFFWSVALLCLAIVAYYVPLFGPACAAPIHRGLWQATMFTVGLLIDALVLTPRIFLGSVVDSLSQSQPTAPQTLFSRKHNIVLLCLIVPLAVATYLAWRPFYTGYIADARTAYRAKHEITPEEQERWAYFDEEIREALQANTLDQAFGSLSGLRHSVAHLPYKDERHRRDADVCIDTAEAHLAACHTGNQTHPDFWKAKYSDAVSDIPKYGGGNEIQQNPVIDPILLGGMYATPTESLLPPPKVTDQRASNTNSVTPSNGTQSPFQTEPLAPANREALEPPSRQTPDKESLLSAPTSPTQPNPRESTSTAVPERSRTNARRVAEPTLPATTPENATEDAPPNPFQKGTTWTGTSLQVSDGGINSANDGIQIQVELSITRHDAEGFEGTVRNPSVIDAQGRRVRWGATASATGTYQNGEVTIRTTPRSVPAGTVLLPGTWTGTVEDGVFSGEFRGPNNSLSDITLQLRTAPQRRSPTK